MTKGIILAGGSGTRLMPATQVVSKQLLPVYDKPLVYYPLTTLMLAGIREILVVSNPHRLDSFRQLLGNGEKFGVEFSYLEQRKPRGIAEALIIGKSFIDESDVALVLGDNLFFGTGLGRSLGQMGEQAGCSISAVWSPDPSNFGVLEFDGNGVAVGIDEKPEVAKSNWVVPGLYFYDSTVSERAMSLSPSPRGELEITDVHRSYLEQGLLNVTKLPRGTAWFDMGTPDSLLDAAEYVRAVQNRQGLLVGSPEEAAWRNGWISHRELLEMAGKLKSSYGLALERLVEDEVVRG